jgi:hypothetical protein
MAQPLAQHRQFDFWLGEWEVFDYSSGTKGEVIGKNTITLLCHDYVPRVHSNSFPN